MAAVLMLIWRIILVCLAIGRVNGTRLATRTPGNRTVAIETSLMSRSMFTGGTCGSGFEACEASGLCCPSDSQCCSSGCTAAKNTCCGIGACPPGNGCCGNDACRPDGWDCCGEDGDIYPLDGSECCSDGGHCGPDEYCGDCEDGSGQVCCFPKDGAGGASYSSHAPAPSGSSAAGYSGYQGIPSSAQPYGSVSGAASQTSSGFEYQSSGFSASLAPSSSAAAYYVSSGLSTAIVYPTSMPASTIKSSYDASEISSSEESQAAAYQPGSRPPPQPTAESPSPNNASPGQHSDGSPAPPPADGSPPKIYSTSGGQPTPISGYPSEHSPTLHKPDTNDKPTNTHFTVQSGQATTTKHHAPQQSNGVPVDDQSEEADFVNPAGQSSPNEKPPASRLGAPRPDVVTVNPTYTKYYSSNVVVPTLYIEPSAQVQHAAWADNNNPIDSVTAAEETASLSGSPNGSPDDQLYYSTITYYNAIHRSYGMDTITKVDSSGGPKTTVFSVHAQHQSDADKSFSGLIYDHSMSPVTRTSYTANGSGAGSATGIYLSSVSGGAASIRSGLQDGRWGRIWLPWFPAMGVAMGMAAVLL